jgi:hypothetical protein
MKNSSLVNVLLAVAAASALASLILCGLYIAKDREDRALRSQDAAIRNNEAFFNQIANDVLEYSKTHPAIEPIIDTYLRPKAPAASAPTKPSATKPASK